MRQFDIVIVGGGPVGLSLAISLLQFGSGLNIAICDRAGFDVPKDSRSFALSAGVTCVFEALGIWDDVFLQASPVAQMKITDSGRGDISRPLFLRFAGDVVPGRPYAHMVPNTHVMEVLLDKLRAYGDAVTFFGGVTASEYSSEGSVAKLTLSDGTVLDAGLVVAADGANSTLRAMAGIECVGHAYDQSGLVTTIAHSLPHEDTAYEHFLPTGPFASLPLPDQRSSLVWSMPHQQAADFSGLPKADLALEIERGMGSVLGTVEIEDRVQVFPLRMQIAKQFVGTRMALIGDAAHVVHPIAGQGLNLGIKDVAALAETIIESCRLGLDFGDAMALERYQRWRRFDTALMAMATDGLNLLFSNDLPPLRALRDLGMGLTDRMPMVKNRLIKHAAAIGPGPKLLRGERL